MRSRSITFTLLLATAAVLPRNGAAQQGISFAPIQFDHVFNYHDITPIYYVIGYDRDIIPGASQRVEVAVQWTTVFRQFGDPTLIGYDGWSAYAYDEAARTFTLTYHSAWFPNRSNEGFYLGASIGVRHSMSRISLPDPSNYYAQVETPMPFEPTYQGSMVMFPVGLRFGLREELVGGYKNFYGGFGYQLGSNGTMFPQPELSSRFQQPAGMTFTVGYAVGFGF